MVIVFVPSQVVGPLPSMAETMAYKWGLDTNYLVTSPGKILQVVNKALIDNPFVSLAPLNQRVGRLFLFFTTSQQGGQNETL